MEAVARELETVAGELETVAGELETVAGQVEMVAGKVEAARPGRPGGSHDFWGSRGRVVGSQGQGADPP